ncbi:MAG: hypothetical protein ACO3WM_06575, partial [Gemmobacter sp.]
IDAAQLSLPGFEPAGATDPAPDQPVAAAARPVPVAVPVPVPAPAAPDVGVLYARLVALRDRMARAG